MTLNHPSWTLGGDSVGRDSGTLPAEFKQSNGTVDWLRVSEFLRKTHSLRGEVSSNNADATQGAISYRGPGYAADAFFDVESGSYEISIKSQGPLGVANDLHKGRDTNSAFRWVIDASAILLILISLSGLTMQLFLRKRRRSALWSLAGGVALLALFILSTVR